MAVLQPETIQDNPTGARELERRYRLMSDALRGVTNPANQAIVNGLLRPTQALRPHQIRTNGTGSNARAIQRFAIGVFGSQEALARNIQELLTMESARVPENLRPFVTALRDQLGNIQPNSAQALTRINRWLTDERAGVATDLAVLLAGRHTTTINGSEMHTLHAWATRAGRGVTGMHSDIPGSQLIGADGRLTALVAQRAVHVVRVAPAGRNADHRNFRKNPNLRICFPTNRLNLRSRGAGGYGAFLLESFLSKTSCHECALLFPCLIVVRCSPCATITAAPQHEAPAPGALLRPPLRRPAAGSERTTMEKEVQCRSRSTPFIVSDYALLSFLCQILWHWITPAFQYSRSLYGMNL